MQIALLHLSDMHVMENSNPICERSDAIAASLRAELPDLKACVIVISGDVAFSGAASEYRIALDFLQELRKQILSNHPSARVEFVVVPGNHDCDFSSQTGLRTLVLDSVAPKLDTLAANSDIVQVCISVQEGFFDFAASIMDKPTELEKRLYYEKELELEGKVIRFQCHNTAWVSRLEEYPGRLCYPFQIAAAADSTTRPAALAVSVLHHPFSWLEPTNARAFAEYIDRTSDIVLTGHDHVQDTYRRHSGKGAAVEFLEGGVLQDRDDRATSAYNILVLDLELRQQRLACYHWRGDMFERAKEKDWTPFPGNPLLAEHTFQNRLEFAAFLEDAGTTFTHPRKDRVFLSDIFVFPDLFHRSNEGTGNQESAKKWRIRGDEVCDFLSSQQRVLITGDCNSGKTSLAKIIYVELKRRKGFVPILLPGSKLNGLKKDGLFKLCREVFVAEYSSPDKQRYEQLDRAQRVIIIDDVHKANLTRRAKAELVEAAIAFAGLVIIFADDLFMVEELSPGNATGVDPFRDFERCSIMELGFRLRAQLISKWHHIGYEYVRPPDDMQHTLATRERLINTLIGKNLLPSYPLTIMTILQTLEAQAVPNSAAGSYGYLYEVLITSALARVSSKVTDLDTKYAYISRLAYAFYKSQSEVLSKENIDDISEEHFKRIGIRFSPEKILKELESAQIFQVMDGQYRFRYRYIYCYFVARYFRDNVTGRGGDEIRKEVRRIADRLHFEDHANIVVFYIYLSRDAEVINHVLQGAKKIYGDKRPCDLDADVEFVNRLYIETEPLLLPGGDPATHQEEERDRLDAEHGKEEDLDDGGRDIVYDEALNDILKINFAFRTLHVLGQVLRNFPGSLDADTKVQLARESYELGLRTLNAILGVAESNLEEFRLYFSRLIKEHRRIGSVAELARSTDELLIWLTLGCAYGIIKRVSYSVGVEELRAIYAQVLEALGSNVAVRLIDTSIKLDHFPAVPLIQIEELCRDLRKNNFASSVLRDVVAKHMYLFQVEYKTRQRLGQLLGIRATDVRYLDNPSKKEK